MADTLRLAVPSAAWPRGAGPLHAATPAGFERASVFRTGSEQSLPCHLERTPEGDRLWWHAAAAAADEAQEFVAFAEDRRRRAPRRVTLARSACGWEAAVRGERWAELLIPAFGPPRLRIHYLGQTLLRLGFGGGTGAWRKIGPTRAVQGPVFGALRARYELADTLGLTLAEARTTWRFFDGPARRLGLELDFELAASCGPISRATGLDLRFADHAGATTQAGIRPGLLGQSVPLQWIVAETAAATVAVLAGADDTRCRVADRGMLRMEMPIDSRLRLGAVRRWRLRVQRGTDRHATRNLPAAYRDFRYPVAPILVS